MQEIPLTYQIKGALSVSSAKKSRELNARRRAREMVVYNNEKTTCIPFEKNILRKNRWNIRCTWVLLILFLGSPHHVFCRDVHISNDVREYDVYDENKIKSPSFLPKIRIYKDGSDAPTLQILKVHHTDDYEYIHEIEWGGVVDDDDMRDKNNKDDDDEEDDEDKREKGNDDDYEYDYDYENDDNDGKLKTLSPTISPTKLPTKFPSENPTYGSSYQPSLSPSSIHPTTPKTTHIPTIRPSKHSINFPTKNEISHQHFFDASPTLQPSLRLSIHPSNSPTKPKLDSLDIIPTNDIASHADTSSLPSLINMISCQSLPDYAVPFSKRHRLFYTYTIETESYIIDDVTFEKLLFQIEQRLLYELAYETLPCAEIISYTDIKHEDDRTYNTRDFGILALDSTPHDVVSETRSCFPVENADNDCRVIDGSLTITHDPIVQASDVESFILNKVSRIISTLPEHDIHGLVNSIFHDPFNLSANDSSSATDNLSTSYTDSIPNTVMTLEQKEKQIILISAILLSIFLMMAMLVCLHQFFSSAKAGSIGSKKLSRAAKHNGEDNIGTSTLSPEDLNAHPSHRLSVYTSYGGSGTEGNSEVPCKKSPSVDYLNYSTKTDLDVRLNALWNQTTSDGVKPEEEDLSIILEGSNEDASSACVSSTFGGFSLLAASSSINGGSNRNLSLLDGVAGQNKTHLEERKLELLDMALAPPGNAPIQQHNMNQQTIPPGSGQQQIPEKISTIPTASLAHSATGVGGGLPLSLHRMNEASQKKARQHKSNRRMRNKDEKDNALV